LFFDDILLFPFDGLADVRREFLQRLSAALHGTLGSYLRDALHEGSADAVACLIAPRAHACGIFPSLFIFSFLILWLQCFSL
jgi:hypothetical protein